jgi:hypothetical protein
MLPPAMLGPAAGLSYDGKTLTVPDGLITTAVNAVISDPNWKTSALKPQLLAYANQKQTAIMTGGTTVALAGGISVKCTTDPDSFTLLQGATTIAQGNANATFNWVPSTGTPITLTSAQMIAMFTAVSTFVQSTFTQLAAVINAINAGTITTTAQVDTPPSPIPAWPVNS